MEGAPVAIAARRYFAEPGTRRWFPRGQSAYHDVRLPLMTHSQGEAGISLQCLSWGERPGWGVHFRCLELDSNTQSRAGCAVKPPADHRYYNTPVPQT
jgi:hypothetical protein